MKAFSVDLRKRVIEAVDNNLHIDEAAKTFKVSRRVIYDWLELREKTSKLEAKTGYQKGHSQEDLPPHSLPYLSQPSIRKSGPNPNGWRKEGKELSQPKMGLNADSGSKRGRKP